MYQHLEPGVPRYVYFYDGIVYQNMKNEVGDLVDSNGRGRDRFNVPVVQNEVYEKGVTTYYDEDVEVSQEDLRRQAEEETREMERVLEEERMAEAARVERARLAEVERIQREFRAWAKQRAIDQAQAALEAASTAVDQQMERDKVALLLQEQTVQEKVDEEKVAEDKVVADQDAQAQSVAVQRIADLDVKNMGYGPAVGAAPPVSSQIDWRLIIIVSIIFGIILLLAVATYYSKTKKQSNL
jgi:hypothetical protein